jgi:glutathione S-transferase
MSAWRASEKGSDMKLYYSDVLNPRKACAVARHLKSPVEFVYLDLAKGEQQTPAFLAVNPNGKVPTLVDDDRIIWETDAVLCHLAMRAGSDLWPRDTNRQIDVIRWLSWNAQHFNRHGGELYFEHVIKPRFGLGPADPSIVDAALVGFRRFAAVLNGHLAGRRWLVGDGLTVADFSVAGVLPYAETARMPLNEFPEVRRWHERLNELEAWREPFPVRVHGSSPTG